MTGCYPQTAAEEVKTIPGVDLIIGNQDRADIVRLVEEAAAFQSVDTIDSVRKLSANTEFEELSAGDVSDKTRAFLKIQEGCNQFCTYCIIPFARGPLRSRSLTSIREEVKKLVASGYKEIVLIGIHLGCYGKEHDGKLTLFDAVEAALSVEGLQRLRLGSLESVEVEARLLNLMEKDKERQSIRTGVKLLFCLLVSGFVFLIACQAVEPEKRAYPQVIGIDWQKEEQRYTVWMHMASLAEDTGQRKQSAETQPGNELYFTGSDGAQIHTAYEATREQYLDMGHVKAVIFGTSLRENRERLREVLKGMESESSLGNSLCIFTTDSLSELSQAVEEQGISLGDFLTGLYENRTDSSAQAPVRLADLYRSCHTDTALPQIPGITVKDRVLMVEKK